MEKENSSASKMIGKCPECGSTRLVKYCEDEDIVCMNCGFVTTLKTVEENSEQTCNSDLEKKLTAQTLKNLGKALPTVRIIRDRKKRRRELAVSDQQARIFERWQKLIKVSDATETRLALAFLEITGIAETLSLPKTVIEVAAAMYKSIVEKRFVRGRSIRVLSAATVYTACKRCGLARILDEIASASRINAIEIARNYRFIIKELNLSISPTKPSQYLSQLLTQLEVCTETEDIAKKILEIAEKLKLSFGRKPVGIAAAVCYIASLITGEKKTQREIAEIAHVTEATIRNRYKELEKLLLFVVTL